MNRFFLEPESWESHPTTLNPRESHHCANVLRHGPGDRVVVFDGRGFESTAEIESVTKQSVGVRLGPRSRSSRPTARITLAQAIPKGKNMDLIIQKAVELGVSCIMPLISERTVVQLERKEAEQKCERWRDVILDACKQSGQNWIPELAPVQRVGEFLRQRRQEGSALIGSLQPDSVPLREALRPVVDRPMEEREAVVMIGPEGDFTPAELAAARSAGFTPVSLGPIVLRSETAAIFCLSVLAYELFSLPAPASDVD